MTDELTNPTPEPETPVEEQAPATPELNDEAVAAYLGVDPEFFTKEVKPQATGLNKLYAKLNAERAKQGRETTAPAPSAPADDEGDFELDARSKKILEKFISEQTAPIVQMLASTVETEMENVVTDFSSTHTDVPADKVDEVMQELGGWQVRTPAELKKNLERAYKLAKADMFDPDAEVERKLAERLKASKDEDAEVVEVTPKRKPQDDIPDENAIAADDDIPWFKKMDMFSK